MEIMHYAYSPGHKNFAKDPAVVKFNGRYYLYYSIITAEKKLGIGIAESPDLVNWHYVKELIIDDGCYCDVKRLYIENNDILERLKIGNNCFVGINTTILKDVTIGDNCVIGAGSIVTKDIPSNTIAYGNPCRVAKEL